MVDVDQERETLKLEYEFLTAAMRRISDRSELSDTGLAKSRDLVESRTRINQLRLLKDN